MTALASLAGKRDLARLTRHGEMIAQPRPPTLRLGKAIVHLPPAAFLQATAAGEAVLARLVLDACAGAASVADLFAGIGPFALRLAEVARVCAVDNDDAALAALGRAAAATASLKPVAIETRDLFRRPLMVAELAHLDAVSDPQRQGALAQARATRRQRRPARRRGIMQSCDVRPRRERTSPRRLPADLVTPIDQFRYARTSRSSRLEITGYPPTKRQYSRAGSKRTGEVDEWARWIEQGSGRRGHRPVQLQLPTIASKRIWQRRRRRLRDGAEARKE
jgi:23S rRNA (uracil1939-C5)-methyltransferase